MSSRNPFLMAQLYFAKVVIYRHDDTPAYYSQRAHRRSAYSLSVVNNARRRRTSFVDRTCDG